jgi:phosphate starvation-inducible membrane PsiE
MSTIPWILISIAVFIIILGFLVFLLARKKRRPTDYYSIFILGICLIIVGIPSGNYAISLLGLIYVIFGLKNKHLWKKNRFNWKKLNKSERKIYAIMMGFILFMVVASVVAFFIFENQVETQSEVNTCIASGGKIMTQMCCKSVGDFPNTCMIGACGCSLENSHEISICVCPENNCFDGKSCVPFPNSFTECSKVGFPIIETYPRQCQLPNGKTFIEGDKFCTSKITGEVMSAFEAMRIAIKSECENRLTDPYLEHSVCNENTGTWWIDLDIEKSGCSPACVVNINTGEAEINWRCTGLLE